MILLADGGSTTVDWCLVDNGKIQQRIITKGANPFFRSTEDISVEINQKLVPEIGSNPIDSIHFYGAGCAFPEKNNIVRNAIADNLQATNIEVSSDLVGAAV